MTRFPILVCLLMAIAVPSGKASSEFFYNENLPAGVVFGMTPEQLAQARPEARTNNLIQSQNANAAGSVAMVEMTRQGNRGTAYWYRFKDGKLGSVSRSISTKNLPPESAQSGASQVYNELRANFDLTGQAEVLRLAGAGTSLLSAQLWEDKEKGRNIYFIASSQEISVIIFDPKSFGAADFFASLDKRKELDAQAESARKLMGESAPSPSPVLDLLPQIVKKSASGQVLATPQPAATRSQTMPSLSTPKPIASPSPTATAATKESPSSGFPIIPVAIVVLVIVGVIVFLLRRKSP